MVMRSKTASRNSIESQGSMEMDEYSDDDEEIFLNSEMNGESSARRPLMKKKKRNGEYPVAAIRTGKPKYKKCCGPLCMMFLGFKTLIGVLIISVIAVNYFTHSGWYFWSWNNSENIPQYAPCQNIKVFTVWQKNFPKFLSEGNLRLVNVSGDSVLDVLVPFGTGSDGYNVPEVVCDIYFDSQHPCLGGVMALDGKTGETLWIQYANHEVFALTCQGDLNQDNITDCLAGGRAGLFFALSGKDGSILWTFENNLIQSDLMSVYAGQFVHDINGDGVPDIFAVHGGDKLSDPALENKMFGRLILFSGSDGTILEWMQTPDRKESYYSPQLLTRSDGEQLILFGTGGNDRGGSLFIISLFDLYKRNIDGAFPIYTDDSKGMLNTASLVDVNHDNVQDIVIATYNSYVIAFDGLTYKQIWNCTFANSETYSTVAVGYYDQDDTPDFFVKYSSGKGFPTYEYEKSVVLSGINGSKISEEIINSLPSQSSPLTISMAGKGNDLFLHWETNCENNLKKRLKYSFPEEVSIHQSSRTDICDSLFGTSQLSQFVATSRNLPNASVIYDSRVWTLFEHTGVVNTSSLAKHFLRRNPGFQTQEDPKEKYAVYPYLKDDFEDKLALLEKELAISNDRESKRGIFLEGESDPIDYISAPQVMKKPGNNDEVIPNIIYSAKNPHTVRKLPKELESDNFENPYSRTKRETTNPHQGIHRLMSTGILAPSILKSKDGIDVIISSHWIYPAKIPIFHPIDEECINVKVKASKAQSTYTDEEWDEKYAQIVLDCLKVSGHMPRSDRTYETTSDYDPFSINMGQLSMYRFALRCECDEGSLTYGQECGKVLSYEKQGWPAYMGIHGNSYFNIN